MLTRANEFRRVRCWIRGMVLLGAATQFCCVGLSDDQLKPTAEELAKARQTIQSIYDKDLKAAKRVTEKASLGRQLSDKSREPNISRAEQYVMLEMALPLSIDGGDLNTALAIVDLQSAGFGVELLAAKAAVFAKMPSGRLSADARRDGLEHAMNLLEQSLEGNEFAHASRFERFADNVIPDVINADKTAFESLSQRLAFMKAEFPKVQPHLATFEKNEPLPADAKTPLGRWLCFAKDDWGRGLPLLAQGTDARLAAIAKQDLENRQAALAQAEIGDLWWSLSDSEKGIAKEACQARAVHWYRQAVPNLTGLRLTSVQRRIDDAPLNGGSGIQLIPVGEYRDFSGAIGYAISGIFSSNSRQIVLAQDKDVVLMDIASQKELIRLGGHRDSIYAARVSPDGKRIVTVAADNKLRVWNAQTGALDKQLEIATEGGGRFCMLSKDGRYVAFSTGGNRTCRLWDLQTSREVQRFNSGGTAEGFRVATLDGRRIISSGIQNQVRLWDLPSAKLLLEWDGAQHCYCSTLSDDGALAITAGQFFWDTWDLRTGKHVRRVQGFQGHIYGVALSPNRKRVVTGFNTGALYIWDQATGTELRVFTGQGSTIHAVAISPDNRMVAAEQQNGFVRIWGMP